MSIISRQSARLFNGQCGSRDIINMIEYKDRIEPITYVLVWCMAMQSEVSYVTSRGCCSSVGKAVLN